MAKSLSAIEVKKNLVRIIQLEKKLTQYNITNFKSAELPFIPSLEFEENIGLIVSKIRELLGLEKLKTLKNVVLILPTRELMVRFFTIAWLSKKERDEAIRYEAQKYIPFSLDEIVSDYYIPYEIREKELRVVFCAIKRTTLEQYLKIAEELGVRLLAAEPYPFSLMRALFFSGDLKPRNFSLILDLDYTSSTILVTQGMNLYLARDFSLNDIDVLKREEIFRKVIFELRRTIDYMIKEFPYQHIKEIIVSGEQLNEEERKQIADEFKVNVKFATLEAKVQSPSSEILIKHLGIIGGALRGSILADIELDLFADYYRKLELVTPGLKRARFLPKELLADLLISFFASLIFSTYIFLQTRTVKRIEGEVFVPRMYRIKGVRQLKEEIVSLKKKKKIYQSIVIDRDKFTPIVNLLPKLLPSGVWLEKLDFISKREKAFLILEGLAFHSSPEREMDLTYDFLDNFKNDSESKKIFAKVDMQNIEKDQIAGYNVVRFVIKAELK